MRVLVRPGGSVASVLHGRVAQPNPLLNPAEKTDTCEIFFLSRDAKDELL
jgi:hypothetical protein